MTRSLNHSQTLSMCLATLWALLPGEAPLAGPAQAEVRQQEGEYPSVCVNEGPGVTGACILSTVGPDSSGAFVIRREGTGRPFSASSNTVAYLLPGRYLAYTERGQFDGYGVPFEVKPGKVTKVTMGTLILRVDGVVAVQIEHDSGSNSDCTPGQALTDYIWGAYTLAPGHYVVDLSEYDSDLCVGQEVEVEIEAGYETIVRQVR